MGFALLAASPTVEEAVDVDNDKVCDLLCLQLVQKGERQLTWLIIKIDISFAFG